MSTVPMKNSYGLTTLACRLLLCQSCPSLIRPAATPATLMPRFVPSQRVLSIGTDPILEWRRHQQSRQQGMTDHIYDGTYDGGVNNGSRDAELHLAVRSGNLETLKITLKNRPDSIESQDEQYGWTPLSYAAYKGDLAMVEYLLKKFPKSMWKPNNDKSFPIHKACMGGHIELLKKFPSKSLSQGDRYGQTILHLAAKEHGDKLKHIVYYLISVPEGRNLLQRKDERGWTPLSWAVYRKNHGVVEILNQNMP